MQLPVGKRIKMPQSLVDFLTRHCVQTSHMFEYRACADVACACGGALAATAPSMSDDGEDAQQEPLPWIPVPVLMPGGDHYSREYTTQTMPKSTSATRRSGNKVPAGQKPSAMQSGCRRLASTARAVFRCCECNCARLVYCQLQPAASDMQLLRNYIANTNLRCGSAIDLFEEAEPTSADAAAAPSSSSSAAAAAAAAASSLGNAAPQPVRRFTTDTALTCENTMETAYFDVSKSGKYGVGKLCEPVCYECGTDEHELNHIDATSFFPLCTACEGAGAVAVARRVGVKRARAMSAAGARGGRAGALRREPNADETSSSSDDGSSSSSDDDGSSSSSSSSGGDDEAVADGRGARGARGRRNSQ